MRIIEALFVAGYSSFYFDDQKAYPATTSGTIDIIGLDINPKKKLKPIKLAFVDLAGDDIQKITPDNLNEFDDKIEGVLRGCETGTPIFCLITPYAPEKGDNAEDGLHSTFMNYVKVKLPNLYDVAKFIIIVTQWDKIPKSNAMPVDRLTDYKPPIEISSYDNIISPYLMLDNFVIKQSNESTNQLLKANQK